MDYISSDGITTIGIRANDSPSGLDLAIRKFGSKLEENFEKVDRQLDQITKMLENMLLHRERRNGVGYSLQKWEEETPHMEPIQIELEVEEKRPDAVELDRDRKKRCEGSIDSEAITALGIHIVNPLPKLDIPMFDGYYPNSWILENNCWDNVKNCSSNSDGIIHLDDVEKEFFNYMSVKEIGNCSNWVFSVAVSLTNWSANVENMGSFLSREFSMIELGWWVKGECHCNPKPNDDKFTYEGYDPGGEFAFAAFGEMVIEGILSSSFKISEPVVEPHNASLSVQQLVENVNECTFLDNEVKVLPPSYEFRIDEYWPPPMISILKAYGELRMPAKICSKLNSKMLIVSDGGRGVDAYYVKTCIRGGVIEMSYLVGCDIYEFAKIFSRVVDLIGLKLLESDIVTALHPFQLIHETKCTILAYGIYKIELLEKEANNVAFVDVGHESLQACIDAFKKGQSKILGQAFDGSLEGKDFDEVFFQYITASIFYGSKVTYGLSFRKENNDMHLYLSKAMGLRKVLVQKMMAKIVHNGTEALKIEVSSHGLALGRCDEIELDITVFPNLTKNHMDLEGTEEKFDSEAPYNEASYHALKLFRRLNEDPTAHVVDFGLSKFLLQTPNRPLAHHGVSTELKGSVSYISPKYGASFQISTLRYGCFGTVYYDKLWSIVLLIEHNLSTAAKILDSTNYVVVLGGNSILRGHFPEEVEVIVCVIGPLDAWIICLFFLQGGHYTIGGIHYVAGSVRLIPIGEKEFPEDKLWYKIHIVDPWGQGSQKRGSIVMYMNWAISRVGLILNIIFIKGLAQLIV